MAVSLLERQLAPIPNPPPITEERLQEKGMVICVYEPDSYNLVHTLQLRNGSSYKRKDTAIRGNLIMLRRRKKTCRQSMCIRSFVTMAT